MIPDLSGLGGIADNQSSGSIQPKIQDNKVIN